ncbi:OadG family protein [Maribellus maritimus]|uniref:OadG family protein n=1 Tax=Maribellus maritimus TaxID=2870838 RepID=UPI001EEAD972|nr:OadG family protein [Maribellus maritimus]MCG6190147.1 OadG family protein [Maribellus maritimus]
MGQNLGDVISIMAVGMVTVFVILWLVVIIGNVIIRITNKYFPGVETVKTQRTQTSEMSSSGKIAAIVAAVDIVTNGKGQIAKITKV